MKIRCTTANVPSVFIRSSGRYIDFKDKDGNFTPIVEVTDAEGEELLLSSLFERHTVAEKKDGKKEAVNKK